MTPPGAASSPRNTDDDTAPPRRRLPGLPALGRRLALVERQLPCLPVPSSSAQSAFVRRFLRTGGPVVKHLPLPWPKPVKERGLQKLSLAVAIAAVLAVFTIAWWSWPRLSAPPAPAHSEPSWVAQIHEKRDRIRALIEPGKRVEQLTVLAAELRGQAESLTYDGDVQGLASLANAYKELLGDDLLGACALPCRHSSARPC